MCLAASARRRKREVARGVVITFCLTFSMPGVSRRREGYMCLRDARNRRPKSGMVDYFGRGFFLRHSSLNLGSFINVFAVIGGACGSVFATASTICSAN